ncbi:MAG TPA: hypothetical protein VF781_04065 [Solirubrobacteraceae bacterium]
MIEPVELTYELELLPPGRTPFRRWRWSLWHGAQLLAAGWRVSAIHAQRAMRVHALRYAHRVNGLHPLRVDQALAAAPTWVRGPVAVEWGDLRVVLTPRLAQTVA